MNRITDSILDKAPEVADPGLRLAFLCQAAKTTYRAIERERELSRGSISNYATGRAYAFPKLRRCVSEHLAAALGEDVNDVRAYLFGDETAEGAAAARGGGIA